MKPSISHDIPTTLLHQLDVRDAALWLGATPGVSNDGQGFADLCKLPWSVVLAEALDSETLNRVEAAERVGDQLVRRRGLVQVVDTDPSEAILPPRHLAIMLLGGRQGSRRTGLAAITRRLTMINSLRSRPLKQLLVAIPGPFAIPAELSDLWADGFRTAITFVSDDPAAARIVGEWEADHTDAPLGLIDLSAERFGDQLYDAYTRSRGGALLIRARDEKGNLRDLDASELDEPSRPILAQYEIIGSDALLPILPSDLTSAEVNGFFADPSNSWRPYAAGMPWERDPKSWAKLRAELQSLDRDGSDQNRILYVTAESGAGSTTLVRQLAWRAASAGYPTLIAQPGAGHFSGLGMANFINRLVNVGRNPSAGTRLYEVPCLLVFDQSHWEGRLTELQSFARELIRSGRRVCILMTAGPSVPLTMMSDARFVHLTNLSHHVAAPAALALGLHLNRFLLPHGTERSDQEWRTFYEESSAQSRDHVAAFWIVLSFWLQRQIDLGETVQALVYRKFAEGATTTDLQESIVRIAAFSTVRTPLPELLLPDTVDWPVSDKLEDLRKPLGALGLIRIRSELERSWVMAHDLLGRYLLTGLFYDHQARAALGFEQAQNPEHLRFMALRRISALPALGLAMLRDIADAFAVSIFKIDPDHGHATLAPYWREVLDALDDMPRSVRLTSRTFLHHGAVSRRRIAADVALFPMSPDERAGLLQRAADDLQAALLLDAPTGAESDLSLYNSLAHALLDLADAQRVCGFDPTEIAKTRANAQSATNSAYALNPDNSFVVETYARTLLSEGQDNPQLAIARAVEVLALTYGLMERPYAEPRRNALGRLAERAFDLLASSRGVTEADPDTEVGTLALALSALGTDVGSKSGLELSKLPLANRLAAAEILARPVVTGNVQAVKLRYLLAVLDRPQDFTLHLELLQSLQGSGPAFSPQLQLEFAVLLFQADRAHEGDRLYRSLRRTWRRGEHFVEVPPRLHWLLDGARADRRQVRAHVAANTEGRAFARVAEFQNIEVPFRAVEFALDRARPGTPLAGYITFNRNGPFLRPLTARQ